MGVWDWLIGRPQPAMTRLDDAPQMPQQPERRDAIVNPFTGLGGVQTKGEAARPVYQQHLTPQELTWAYEFGGVVTRAVNALGDDTMGHGVTIRAVDDNGQPTPDNPVADQWREINASAVLAQSVKWASLYGGCVILLISPVSSPADLLTPLPPGAPILGLQVIDRLEARPLTYDERISSPNFRRGEIWSITPVGVSTSRQVHHSRLLYIPGIPAAPHRVRDLEGYDLSLIQTAWAQIRNHSQVGSAGAVIAQEMKQGWMKLKGYNSVVLGNNADALSNRMAFLAQTRAVHRLAVMDSEDDFGSVDQTVTGFDDLHDAARADLSAALGIPQVRLFGMAPAGMSTDDASGWRQYRDRIAQMQQSRVAPAVRRLVDLLLAAAGEDVTYEIEFPPLDEPTTVEQADARLKDAQTDALRIQSGVLTPEHVARSRYKATGYSAEMDPVSDADADGMPFSEAERLEREFEGDDAEGATS